MSWPATDGDVPTEWDYKFLKSIQLVAVTCGGNANIEDVLVVRDEYTWLRDQIESGYLAKTNAMVVTGQPGVGKTAFLLYLLLDRLEHRRPTAIQLSPNFFVIFNEHGVFVCDPKAFQLLDGYWALVDSNDRIKVPCDTFVESPGVRIIQTASPSPERWKNWLKQKSGKVVVSDLPRPLEIGAILKELGILDYDQAYHYISKWGPCTRTILGILREEAESRPCVEDDLTAEAQQAMKDIYTSPTILTHMNLPQSVHSIGSTLLFISPHRPLHPNTSAVLSSSISVPHIPTPHLASIFNQYLLQLSNDKALALFDVFSKNAFTKSPAGWMFERQVHVALCCHSAPIKIFRRHGPSDTISPSQ
ncbi:hypothetical protein LXA43DRAFT_1166020 [Ganoderma leucocontextum]|nr:hypothetical protein LXA43DRAFT_1166020 [Ganoderma leucocontextum]